MDQVKVGLSPFTTYINTVGADRIRVIREQQERYSNPAILAWWPYQNAFIGLRNAVASADYESAVEQLVRAAPSRMREHYEEIGQGIRRLLSNHRYTLVPVQTSRWSYDGLNVTVANCLGLRAANGDTICAFPYFKAGPVTASVQAGIARMLETTVDPLLPGATTALLDVRAGRVRRLPVNRKRTELDQWLHAEARGYLEHWRGTAA